VEIIRILLDAGADPNDSFETTPLIIAAHSRQFEVVSYLLTIPSIAPNATNRAGATALILAARAGWNDLARLLIGDARVNVNVAAEDGNTALLWAIRRGSLALCRAILKRPDVDLTMRTQNGGTLLHAAVKSPQMFAALMARGVIDINAVDAAGETALHKAAWVGGTEVVSMLLANGANVDIALERSGTALHFAIAQKQEEIAKKLIEVPEMNVNWRSTCCPSPINLAIAGNLRAVVQALCKREDLSFNGGLGKKSLWPPLVAAAHAGNVEMLRILLECQRLAANNELCGMKVALEVATSKGLQDFGQLLKDAQKPKVVEKKSKRFGFGFFKRFRRSKKSSKHAQ
jgi:hypothetical protein